MIQAVRALWVGNVIGPAVRALSFSLTEVYYRSIISTMKKLTNLYNRLLLASVVLVHTQAVETDCYRMGCIHGSTGVVNLALILLALHAQTCSSEAVYPTNY